MNQKASNPFIKGGRDARREGRGRNGKREVAREGLSEGRMEDKRDTMREERKEVGGQGQAERKESERKGVGKIRQGWVVKVRD